VAGAITPSFRSSDALLGPLAQAIQLAPESVKTTTQLPSHVVQNASASGVPWRVRAVDTPVSAIADGHAALRGEKVATTGVGITPDHWLVESPTAGVSQITATTTIRPDRIIGERWPGKCAEVRV